MATEDILLLILIVAAFVAFAVALAYGSAVAGGREETPQALQDLPKSRSS